jgi:hypothetical protein
VLCKYNGFDLIFYEAHEVQNPNPHGRTHVLFTGTHQIVVTSISDYSGEILKKRLLASSRKFERPLEKIK